jgi:hypothetical protein
LRPIRVRLRNWLITSLPVSNPKRSAIVASGASTLHPTRSRADACGPRRDGSAFARGSRATRREFRFRVSPGHDPGALRGSRWRTDYRTSVRFRRAPRRPFAR